MTESRVCPLCGAEAYSGLFFARDFNRRIDDVDFHYLRCGDCGAIRLANPPDDPARYYGADYYGLPVDADALLRGSRFDRYKLEIVQRFAASGRMLEVGPGAGGFAYLAKLAGFDVSVIEPGKNASQFISEQLGIKVLDQSETLGGEQLGEFDVVALWHVLEHIDHVDAFLANVGQRVRRGGLLVLALPNPRSVQFRVFGRFWVHLDAPRHVNLLPASSLEQALRLRGFSTEWLSFSDRCTQYWNSLGWVRSSRNLPLPRELAPLALLPGYGLAALSRLLGRFDFTRSAYTLVARRLDR